ncbi:MAG: polysulfide reductase NrfD [Chloroflexi bacterium]|nr:polysulfide reductase NrfD [Chloroflexota bacterium]
MMGILKPLARPSGRFYVLLVLAGAAVAWFLFYAWPFQLRYGLIVTGLADWGSGGGVPWGVYIGSFIWWVGIAHGGIIISASVRLFKIKSLAPVARLAELMTIAALTIAASFIIIDLGRPDRVVTSVIRAFPLSINHSPLIWDVTVITLYFVMTGTYLLLTLRRDTHMLYDIMTGTRLPPERRSEVYAMRRRLPPFLAPLYRRMHIGYHQSEDKKVEQMVWFLALGLIILAPLLLHGGVIPWLFQLLPSMPGYFSAIQGPTFLSIALTSAMGAVLVIAYVFRRVYGWKELLPDRTFFVLGGALAFFALLFLWLQLQQIIWGSYAPSLGVAKVTEAKVESPFYWTAIGLVGASLLYLGAQLLYRPLFSVSRTVVAGLASVLAVFIEKALFVVEGLEYPAFRLYQAVPGQYSTTWVENSAILYGVALLVLLLMVMAKVIPVIEMKAEE